MKSHSEQLEDLQNLRQQTLKEQVLLKAQQEYLEGIPLETKIAAAHLEKIKRERVSIQDDIKKLNADFKEVESFLAKYIRSSKVKQSKVDDALKSREDKLTVIDQRIIEANKTLNSINEESATRKRYLLEQEKIITHMMNDANESINKVHDRYAQLERAVSSMEVQKSTLSSDIETLLLDKGTLEAEASTIEESNTSRLLEIEVKIKKANSKLSEIQAQYRIVEQEIDRKKSDLHAEIEAIDAKRSALFKESEQLAIEKRRFTSSNNLHGI